MISVLRFHHVGVITADMEKARALYAALGYAASETWDDPVQKARIVFMSRGTDPVIELIQPTDEAGPAMKWVKRVQAGPYHTCYEARDLDAVADELREFGLTAVFGPVPAVAFGGRNVMFLWGPSTGLLELVESA